MTDDSSGSDDRPPESRSDLESGETDAERIENGDGGDQSGRNRPSQGPSTGQRTGAASIAGEPRFSLRAAGSNCAVRPVDPQYVLDGVMQLGINRWEDSDREDVEHVGPAAGEFHDAFDLGSGQQISNVDASGVALAAIQGLAEQLARKTDRIEAQAERIEDLEDRLRLLETQLGRRDSTNGD